MTAPRFVAACVQMRSGRDPAQNRDAAVAGIREAAERGAHYVQTPEMTSLLERDRPSLFEKIRSPEHDPTLGALCDVARERGVVVHVGSLAVRNGDKVANRAFVIDREGAIQASYDKLHLYDVDLPNGESYRESATYTGGARAVVTDLPWGRLGVAICYDVRFPALYRALAEARAEILSAPAAFTRQTARRIGTCCSAPGDRDRLVHDLGGAGRPARDGRETYGHSLIVDPRGRVLAEADGTAPGVILAEKRHGPRRGGAGARPGPAPRPAGDGRGRLRPRPLANRRPNVRRHRVSVTRDVRSVAQTSQPRARPTIIPNHDPLRPVLRFRPQLRELVPVELVLRRAGAGRPRDLPVLRQPEGGQADHMAPSLGRAAALPAPVEAPSTATSGPSAPGAATLPVPVPAPSAPADGPVSLVSEPERQLRAMIVAPCTSTSPAPPTMSARTSPRKPGACIYGETEQPGDLRRGEPERGALAPGGGHRVQPLPALPDDRN